MKVFTNSAKAWESYETKTQYLLNSVCPDNPHRLCGNWCAKFYISEPAGESDGRYVILGCKGVDKRLYVEEVI